MKPKFISAFSILFLFAIGLVSCKKATYLKADVTEISSTIKGGDIAVGLHSDVANYEVTYTPEWAVPTLKDSILSLKVQPNSTGAVRTDSVVISCAGMSITLPITQYYVATYMNLEVETLSFEKEGGEENVKIDTDGGEVVASDLPDGVTATYSNGVMTFKAQPNNAGTIKANVLLSADSIQQKIFVEVKGNICARCNGSGKIKCPYCKGYGETADAAGMHVYCCTRCGGAGGLYCGAMDYRPGSGRMRCPDCNGTGH